MMQDGIEKRIENGVCAALDMLEMLVAAGQPLKKARSNAQKLTLAAIRESTARDFSNKSGAVITHTLATTPVQSTPAPAKRSTKAKQPQTVN